MIEALLYVHLFMQIQAAVPPQLSPPAATLLQSGVSAENQNDLDHAIVDFREAANLAPSSPVVLLRLGDAYMRKHDYAAAVPPLQRAVELAPDSLPIHRLLGYALLSQGYAAEAIPHLEMVHDYGALGIAELQTDQPAKGVIHLENALEKNPNDPDILYYLNRASTALSSQSADRLLAEFPETARGHQMLGQNYFAMKMLAEAEKEYQQAITMRPDLPGLHLELGQIYAAGSEWTRAAEQFGAEAKLQPGSAEAAYRLGDALLQEGKMKAASEQLRRSDLLRADMPETLYDLGRATAVSDPVVAEGALKRVVALERERTLLAGQAYLLLAEIHRRQGKPEVASQEMQAYRRIHTAAINPSK
jgi:tetratricopeptide (TPR) repeat protein